MRKIFLLLTFLISSIFLFAQNLSQTIRGIVIDEDTQLPLIGASVFLLNTEPTIGTVTDADGAFRLKSIPIGRASIKITYLGYQDKLLSNIEVNSAKEVVLDISLEEALINMDEVVVKATQNKGDALNDLALISARSVSAEQTSRYAGGFNDPSKIVSNFAGVASSQDGGNEIIVRGNSPKYVQWRLEGAQITNPNHFADQNALSGIVNSLNNNLLATSDFYTGAFPAEFGDALSGIYDIRMRKGNNEKFEGIFGLGILGTDITLEGPIKKGYEGSFLLNYRYSTIGLATDLGIVNVEGANLKFQDAAFKIYLPTKRLGTFSLFGLQGKSSFLFEDVDPGIWVTPGDDFIQTSIMKDYNKAANLLNTGINHIINITSKSYLKTTFLYSNEGISDQVYNKIGQDSTTIQQLDFNNDLIKSTYRLNSIYNYKINAKHKISLGVRFALFNQNMNQSLLDNNGQRMNIIDFDKNISSLQSFVNWKFKLNNQLTVVAGLHNTNVLYNHKSTLEPRLALSYQLSGTSTLSLGYGNHSMMESIHNYFAKVLQDDGTYATPNTNLGLLRANHFVLGYEHYFSNNLRVKLETYYQALYHLPVENNSNSSYATLNEGLELNYVDLVNKGKGKNYGVELTLERFLNQGYYFLFNTSLYQSKYTALDGIERDTKFNGKYIVNVLAGKEFSGWGKKNNQIFAINAKAFLGGGRPIIPLLRDEKGDLAVDVTKGLIYDYQKAYQSQLDNLVNIVLSVSYKWNKAKTTHELFLNIDNLTNNRARITEFYDTNEPNSIGYERQVGVVPNFLYRIYF